MKLLTGSLFFAFLSAPHLTVAAELLEREMSRDEFKAAGLHRLTAAELRQLNEYLGRANGRVEQKPDAGFGEEQLEKPVPRATGEGEVAQIRSQIKGDFRGWEGRTVFRLANGQIWQQRLSGRYRYRATDPEVIIERGRFGYYLVIPESGRKIAVKRLK